jgi:hypothetical protein
LDLKVKPVFLYDKAKIVIESKFLRFSQTHTTFVTYVTRALSINTDIVENISYRQLALLLEMEV